MRTHFLLKAARVGIFLLGFFFLNLIEGQLLYTIALLFSQSYPALCNPMDCSTPGFPVLHHLPELAQTHVHWVADAIQSFILCCPLLPPAFRLSQHQGLFQ